MKKASNKGNYQVGETVWAPWDDGLLYRAQITKLTRASATVTFLDDDISATVQTGSLEPAESDDDVAPANSPIRKKKQKKTKKKFSKEMKTQAPNDNNNRRPSFAGKSPYFLFRADTLPKLASATSQELNNTVASMWKALTQEKKQVCALSLCPVHLYHRFNCKHHLGLFRPQCPMQAGLRCRAAKFFIWLQLRTRCRSRSRL
jgi:hypothetical protein